MRIVLMRHGKPLLPVQESVTSLEFRHWIDAYNAAELCEELKPKPESVEIAQACHITLCSSLKRSLQSAEALGRKEVAFIEHSLREMEMPWGKMTGVKLKPEFWALIFRTLWFLGYSKNCESFKDARSRALQAAILLEKTAREKGSVLFVGHGMLNRYIARCLVENGWLVRKKIGSAYWQFGIFEREASGFPY